MMLRVPVWDVHSDSKLGNSSLLSSVRMDNLQKAHNQSLFHPDGIGMEPHLFCLADLLRKPGSRFLLR